MSKKNAKIIQSRLQTFLQFSHPNQTWSKDQKQGSGYFVVKTAMPQPFWAKKLPQGRKKNCVELPSDQKTSSNQKRPKGNLLLTIYQGVQITYFTFNFWSFSMVNVRRCEFFVHVKQILVILIWSSEYSSFQTE